MVFFLIKKMWMQKIMILHGSIKINSLSPSSQRGQDNMVSSPRMQNSLSKVGVSIGYLQRLLLCFFVMA